jgi:hypothetical protein
MMLRAMVAGCVRNWKLGCGWGWPKGKGVWGKSEKGFVFFFQISFETLKPIEFKQKFESKHSKIMHRHECNRELLYFIN